MRSFCTSGLTGSGLVVSALLACAGSEQEAANSSGGGLSATALSSVPGVTSPAATSDTSGTTSPSQSVSAGASDHCATKPLASAVISANLSSSAAAAPSAAPSSGEASYVAKAAAEWGGKPLGMLPYATSGSRIAALGYADEGAVVFQKLRDTKLGFDCTFAKSETGELHCAPLLQTQLLFLDAACTQPAAPGETSDGSGAAPLLRTDDYITPVRYRSSSEMQGAELPNHGQVYRVAEKLSESHYIGQAEEPLLFALNGKDCLTATPRVAKSVPSIYRLVPVEDTELVAASVKEIALENGLTLERIVASDTAEISSGLRVNGGRCLLQPDGKCVPLPIAAASDFADSDCSDIAYYLETPPAPNTTVYGLSYGDASNVYELTPADTWFYVKDEYKSAFENGQMTLVRTVLGCFPRGASQPVALYHRAKDVSAQMLTLDKVKLGTAQLQPEWFSAKVSDSNVTVLVRRYLKDSTSTATRSGGECSISGTTCTFADGSSLSLAEVKL